MWKIDRDIFYSMGESQIKPRDNPDILEITNYPWNKVCSHLFLKEIGIEFGPYRMNEDIYPHWQILSNTEQVKFFMRHLVRYSLSNQGHATNVMDRSRFQLIDVLVKTKKMLDEHPEGKYFKKSFFSFCYRVLCWAYDALPNDLQPEFRSYSRRLVFSLTKEDIGYLSAAGKDVANYFYWVIS